MKNSPFELRPSPDIWSSQGIKRGALLVHGLFDGPFTLKDIGHRLQQQGILSRAVLLPGHGALPSDLLTVSYHDWIETVRSGIDDFRHEVDQLYLIGYSTGAALSLFHALQDNTIAGVVLLSPAIHLRYSKIFLATWQRMKQCLHSKNKDWIFVGKEVDKFKYASIAFNAVYQVIDLAQQVKALADKQPLSCPMLMIVSHEDETISSRHAIQFFSSQTNPASRLRLYSATKQYHTDQRIQVKISRYPELNILNFSHVSLPFAPDNPHYGQAGDYIYASRPENHLYRYGAYNRFEVGIYEKLYCYHLTQYKRRPLTYNPDFDDMAEQITGFLIK